MLIFRTAMSIQCKFITRKLWGAANQPPYFHHGRYTTMREAIEAHAGEALASRQAFQALSKYEQDCLVEFLKSLQLLPAGSKHLVVDETGKQKIGGKAEPENVRP